MGFTSKPSVTIIVPAFNEVENVAPLLAELSAKLPMDYEVIIVDDGSTDGTFQTAVAARARPLDPPEVDAHALIPAAPWD